MHSHLILLFLSFLLTVGFLPTHGKNVASLAKNGKANYTIHSPSKASVCEKFAAQELRRFLSEMSGAHFEVSHKIQQHSMVVSALGSLPQSARTKQMPLLSGETYSIFKHSDTIYLVGGNPRATLFAVYDFLKQLGCQWVAPGFEFFGGSSRRIPSVPNVEFVYKGMKTETPQFKYRKLYIEEGRTHQIGTLTQLVDWMPKLRYNTLVIPIDYQGHGKVKWDNWREDLIPELQKRGIVIEVGGHGYQNFMNASMAEGDLFKEHPEWFGMDNTGIRSKNPRIVLCTSNTKAVAFMFNNILSYLTSHPEIDIFDFWPPDSEIWCQCETCKAMGNETDRHAMLVNHLSEFLHKEMPEVILECLAYSRYIAPTQNVTLNAKVLLDFCPINQCFEYQIYESGAAQNKAYNEDLVNWKKTFGGDISIYSYFRKYAWRSLPNVIPHFMQHELNHYHSIGAKGVSVYSEPGDWFTYGVNHFVFSNLAWNPGVDVDALIEIYSKQVYGGAAAEAILVYKELEDIVRFACNLPYTSLKKPEDYDRYATRIITCRQQVKTALDRINANPLVERNLTRLGLMLEYAHKSIDVMRSKTLGNKEETTILEADVKRFLSDYAEQGVFIPFKQ